MLAFDRIGEREFEISARKVVRAVGPWTNVLMHKEEGNVPSRRPDITSGVGADL